LKVDKFVKKGENLPLPRRERVGVRVNALLFHALMPPPINPSSREGKIGFFTKPSTF